MKNLVKFTLVSTLLLGAFGCSSESSEKAAADARDQAADARVDAADANARVAAADAHVKAADARVSAADAAVDAADADARAEATENRAAKNTRAKVVIPSGTVLKVSLVDGLNSETSSAGDRFLASLSESVVIDGRTLLERGTMLRGRVIDVEGAGRVKGKASIRLTLTDIMQGNRTIAIATQTFAAESNSTQKRDVGIIAGGAGVGAVIGAIAGGKKGAAIGTITGGGAGTGVVLATKGEEIHYGPETRLNFTLSNSVDM